MMEQINVKQSAEKTYQMKSFRLARLPASMIKANQEKLLRSNRKNAKKKNVKDKIHLDKEYEENAALKEADDQGKRIQIIRERHQQLRQLFFKQARTNRMKVNQTKSPFDSSLSFSTKNGRFPMFIPLVQISSIVNEFLSMMMMMIMIGN